MSKYTYTCQHCGYEHVITDDYYLYHIIKNYDNIQEPCQNCGKTLYLEKEKDIKHAI